MELTTSQPGFSARSCLNQMDRQQYHNRTSRKKNIDCLNDQLIPKPTEVNVADKMMSSVTLKDHPYSSHMSRCAIFPSFLSSDDPDSRFSSTSQAFLDSCVPNRVQNVILLSKTKGNPYRHEIMESPVKTKKMLKGENDSLNYTKLKKEGHQVFYSTSSKQHDWYLSKSTRNMLQSLQNKLWRTSYHVDYTEPSSVERPTHRVGKIWNISPTKSGPRDISPPPSQNPGVMNQHGSQEITSIHDDVPLPNQIGHSQVEGKQHTELFPEIQYKQRAWNKSSAHEGRHKESCKVRFDKNLMQESKSQRSQEGNAAQITDAEWRLDLYSRPHSHMRINRESRLAELSAKTVPNSKKEELTVVNFHGCCQPVLSKNRSSHVEFLSEWPSEQEGMTERRELRQSVSGPCSFPSVLQKTGSGNKAGPVAGPIAGPVAGPVAGAGSTVSLLELQNSLSKSEAHRNFNNSVTRTVMNLRDNVTSGKKHNFYGINCNYIHG